MLNEQEILQICSKYELVCTICETKNVHFRLKRDMARPSETEGDGHPLQYKWRQAGFDSVDPLQFFWGVCPKCLFAGDMSDPEFRQAERKIKEFRATLQAVGLRKMLTNVATGKGISQALGKRLDDEDMLVQAVAKFHLGIFSQCLRVDLSAGNIARFYLRIAWLFRDQEKYYSNSNLQVVEGKFVKLRKRWKGELPDHKHYPLVPGLALNEVEALRYSRVYFERNYETLKDAKFEDEFRLSLMLAEIGYGLYELTDDVEDYKKAAAYFGGTMQKCLSIVNDKSVVGGAVNRAKEILELAGERGRALRGLNKSRGGSATAPEDRQKTPKKKAKENLEKKMGAKKTKEKLAKVRLNNEKFLQAESGASENGPRKGEGVDLDQTTRQVNLLQAEVESLRERLKHLDDDNKKWRQLAGRDTVTGLPNKTTLFRLILPKTLRILGTTGPYSFIGISLDQVAKVNEGHGWLVGDKMLKESVRSMRCFVAEGEELYRLDGAHFAIFGAMEKNVARQRAADVRRKLSRSSVQVDQAQLPLISSIGVVTVDRLLGEAVNKASNSIFEALLATLYRAKGKGGNTVELHDSTKF